MKQYAPPPVRGWRRYARWLAMAAFTFFCFVYGFGFALTAPYLIVPFATPIAILAIIAIWALPGMRAAPERTVEALFFAYFVVLIVWPNYLAIALPGLPWLTLMRLTGIPMVVLLLVCVSVSQDFRTKLADTLSATPLLWKLMVAFVFFQFITIVASNYPSTSLSLFFRTQLNWTAVFFASCYVFAKPGRVRWWAIALCVMAMFLGLMSAWENEAQKVLWSGHVPSFLKIEDAANRLEASYRSATKAYRVKSVFTTALGLGEFIAFALPFLLHFAFGRSRLPWKLACIAAVPLLVFVAFKTDSRLALIGAIMSILLYLLFWSLLRWRRYKTGLLGPTVVLAYPVLFAAVVAATFVVPRLRRSVWGGGAQAASNAGRDMQVENFLPAIIKNPFGYGIGQSAEVLGTRGRGDMLTIDNYYIGVALEYGVLGFLVYYGMMLLAIWYSARSSIQDAWDPKSEFAYLVPISIALTNFFVIKGVFAQTDLHGVYYMLLGMVVALMARARGERAERQAALG